VDLNFYKLIHLAGLGIALLALGSIASCGILGTERSHPWRRRAVQLHGLGLLLALIGGFGMVAKYKYEFPYPLWIQVKFAAWLLMGMTVVLLGKSPALARIGWWLALLLFAGGGWLALHKPS
jgi:hypothetical protein